MNALPCGIAAITFNRILRGSKVLVVHGNNHYRAVNKVNGRFVKNALVLIVPLSLLAVGAVISTGNFVPVLPEAPFTAYLPFVLAGTGVLFGIWFKRYKVAFPLILIALAHGVMLGLPPGPPGGDIMGQVVYAGLAVLLPLNLLAFAFVSETGPPVSRFISGISWIAVQLVAVVVIVDSGTNAQNMAAGFFHARIFPTSFDAWSYLPQPGILFFAFALLVLLVRLTVSRSALDYAMPGTLIATALALHMVGRGAIPSLFFAIGILILVLGTVQDVYRMAYMDELTGLAGRRALSTAMKSLSGNYAIAMLDVDHFKKFNDTYGHDTGDQVLKMVASIMRGVRGGGTAFRFGGEEFSILFPSSTASEAYPHLDKLRQAISSSGFSLRGENRPATERRSKSRGKGNERKVGVTISIGVAGPDGPNAIAAEVLKSADKALYKAKAAGRNRVSRR